MSAPVSAEGVVLTPQEKSTFLYIETVCVDLRGRPDHRRMNEDDCVNLDRFEKFGFLEWHGTGANPLFKLTDAGWALASKLRRERAERNFGK